MKQNVVIRELIHDEKSGLARVGAAVSQHAMTFAEARRELYKLNREHRMAGAQQGFVMARAYA